MELPAGATCAVCSRFERCKRFLRLTGKETACNWFPRRFVMGPLPTPRELDESIDASDCCLEVSAFVDACRKAGGFLDGHSPGLNDIAAMHRAAGQVVEKLGRALEAMQREEESRTASASRGPGA
jgi:hypothetical protein